MKNNLLIKIIFITLIFIIMFSIIYKVEAFNPEQYDPGSVTQADTEKVWEIGSKIYGALKNIATVVAILTITIIGVKYIFGSVEQKAEYKATLVPWFAGAILVVMVTSLLEIIERLVEYI